MKKYELVRRELMAVERAAWWNPQVRRILKVAPLVVMFLLLNTRSARASCSFNPTPDPTRDGAPNSLRAAIQRANASGQDCMIRLQAGTYTLSIQNTNGQENAAAQGDLDITDSGHTVAIEGRGEKVSIINGNGVNGINDRVFQVLGGANAVFSKLTIEGGIANDDGTASAQPGTTESDGGGMLVQDSGHVTLSHVWVRKNQAVGGAALHRCAGHAAAGGGLLLNTGTVKLIDSNMTGNAATGGQGTGCTPTSGTGGTGAGGGLYVVSGNVTLSRSTVAHNSAKGGIGGTGVFISELPFRGGAGGGGAGGGLYLVSGSAALIKSEVSGNRATGGLGGNAYSFGSGPAGGGNGGAAQGGGVFVGTGAFRIRQTTVSSNSATGGDGGFNSGFSVEHPSRGGSSQGAGIFVASGNLTLANGTFYANTAKGGAGGAHTTFCISCSGLGGDATGGGLYIGGGSVSLTGDTVASNQALTGFEPMPPGSSSGGGIANAGATRLVSNTTLIGNNTQDSGDANNGDDVSGAITSSHSLIGQTAGATIIRLGGNIFDQDPLLDPGGLKFNGGPTQTIALQLGSPAINKGDNAVCAAPAPMGLAGIDQRGYDRFPNGDNLCDIGAFEFYNLLVHPKFAGFEPQPVGQQSQPRNLFITNNQTSSVTLSASIGGSDPADFIENDHCGATLAANASCTIAITFKPAASGERSALITVSDSPDRTSPYTVKLVGEGE
jgi:centrosomal CEP192-like protein